jgi:uncharacterized protein with GYD domain
MCRQVYPADVASLLIAEGRTRWLVRRLQGGPCGTGRAFPKEERAMALYKLDFAYTPETWAALTKAPEDRTEAVRAALQSAGGRLIGLYYGFGETDGFVLFEAPDSLSASAAAMTVLGSGRFKTIRTTEIFTAENAVEAMRRAGGMQYQPPGQR